MPPKKKSKITEKNVLKCDRCDYTTPRKAFMDDHIRIHTGDRPYTCSECGKGFTQKSNLTKHQIVHGAGYTNEFKCSQCDFVTRYKQSLKMHLNWHEGVKPYACKVCDRTFSQSTHRRTHMKEAHGDERKYQCHLCSKPFKRKEHLDKHIAFHKNERNFACDVCGKTFIGENHVETHKLIHGGEATKVHQCDMCPYKSRYKQGLQVHYRIHLGLRPYKCDQCPKAFRTSQTYRIHSRMVHQGLLGKSFHCEHCEYRTANKQSLKKHIENIHVGAKKKMTPYPCVYCGNVYQSHASLHGHKRKKHPMKLRQEMNKKLQAKLAMIKIGQDGDGKESATLTDYRYKFYLLKSMKNQLNPHNKINTLNKFEDKKAVIKLDANDPIFAKLRRNPRKGMKTSPEVDAEKTNKNNIVAKENSMQKTVAANKKSIHKDKSLSPRKDVPILPKESNITPVTPKIKYKIPVENVISPVLKNSKPLSSTKKPVHDLIQERLAKKRELLNKPKASKKIDFAMSTNNNTHTSEFSNLSRKDQTHNSKASYMSGLGLLQRYDAITTDKDDQFRTLGTIQIHVPNESKKTKKLPKSPKSLGTIQIHVPNERKKTKKTPKSFPKIKAPKVIKGTKSRNDKSSPPKKIRPKSPAKAKSSRKDCVQAESPRANVGKSTSSIKDIVVTNSTSWFHTSPSTGTSMIVYEPVDVPSLGPYSSPLAGSTTSQLIQVSPNAGNMVAATQVIMPEQNSSSANPPTMIAISDIKEEPVILTATTCSTDPSGDVIIAGHLPPPQTEPINYTTQHKQYDSLRALASNFL